MSPSLQAIHYPSPRYPLPHTLPWQPAAPCLEPFPPPTVGHFVCLFSFFVDNLFQEWKRLCIIAAKN